MLALAAAIGTVLVVFRAGDAGARAVWEGVGGQQSSFGALDELDLLERQAMVIAGRPVGRTAVGGGPADRWSARGELRVRQRLGEVRRRCLRGETDDGAIDVDAH